MQSLKFIEKRKQSIFIKSCQSIHYMNILFNEMENTNANFQLFSLWYAKILKRKFSSIWKE